jgi:hypothetical protein
VSLQKAEIWFHFYAQILARGDYCFSGSPAQMKEHPKYVIPRFIRDIQKPTPFATCMALDYPDKVANG